MISVTVDTREADQSLRRLRMVVDSLEVARASADREDSEEPQ